MPLSHWNQHSKNQTFPSGLNKPTGKLSPAIPQSKAPSGTGRLAVAIQGLNPQTQAEQNPQFSKGARKKGKGYGSTPPGKWSPTDGSGSPAQSGKAMV